MSMNGKLNLFTCFSVSKKRLILSAAHFAGSGAFGNGVRFGGLNAAFGAAYCPSAGWFMVNICFYVHHNGGAV